MERQLDEAFAAVRLRGEFSPRVGVVLGSGLGGFASGLSSPDGVSYADIPHMPLPSVPGHAGQMVLGHSAGVPVACLQGRAHLYEGHSPSSVVFGCRLLARLGCHSVLLTNAAGGIRVDLGPGSLMLVTDHINLTAENPLVALGESFVDMTKAYDPALIECARNAARDVHVDLSEGVYAAMRGPSYETPAEIRMLRALGADAVGMSTVLETIALRRAGVRVGAVSCITNFAAGLSGGALSHEEVTETALRVEQSFGKLMSRWIALSDAGNEAGRQQ